MTTQSETPAGRHYTSRPLGPEAAQALVVDLEHAGLDASRISISTKQPMSEAETGRVDGATVQQPFGRTVAAGAIGAVVGAALAALVTLVVSVPWAPIVLTGAIVGGLLGAIYALYWRLPMSADTVDTAVGSPSIVTVDVSGLDEDEADDFRRHLAEV